MTVRGAPRTAGAPQTPINVGVRHRDAPYEFLWQESAMLSRDWQNLAFVFSPQKKDGKAGLYISSSNEGTVDFGRIELRVTTREEYAKSLEVKYPNGGPPNLLAQTRFPFGLPAGWMLDVNWGDDRDDAAEPQASADAKVPGPSGSPALHIRGQRAFIVRSAPFVPLLAHRKHVASLSLRGSGRGFWGVYAGDKELARQNIDLNDAPWQRQHLVFSPDLATEGHVLRFQSESGFNLWIDALQVEAGESPKGYSTQMPVEVGLSSGSLTDVHFTDEAAQVKYFAGNAPTGSAIKFRIVNVYGEEANAPAIKLSADKQNGTLNYALFPKHPLGVYRVEAWVEDVAGKRISPFSELIVNRLRRPRYWGKDAPQSPFGIHMRSATSPILKAKSMGINWARLHDATYVSWDFVERQKGKWGFYDSKIQLYRKHGIKLLGGLSTTPPWARINKTTHDAYADRWSEPANLADYANYVKTITSRYKGIIDAYEIWNEPWLSKVFWHASYEGTYKASTDPQASYARLMQTGYKAAKAVDPSIRIAGINTTTHEAENGIIDATLWTRGVVGKGGLEACDILSYHHYMGETSGFPGDIVEKGYQKGLGPILEKNGNRAPKPVWMSEGSPLYGVNKSQGMYRYTLATPNVEDNSAVADKLCRYVVSLLGQGVEKVFLYSMATEGSIWAVLVNFDGSLHPSGAAHSNMAWELEDTKFSKRIEVAPNVFAYLFSGKGRAVAVLAPREQTNYTLPNNAKFTISDLWGNAPPTGSKLGTTLNYISFTGSVDTLQKALQTTARQKNNTKGATLRRSH
jgi:hypothetical protein